MKPLRVLVAEDEAPARRKLLRLLAAAPDIEVAGEAGDGASALRQIEALKPDLVLLDISMPPPDGLEIAAALAAAPPPRPQVIFLTAHADHAIQAFALDARDYLLKPYRAERLTLALERARARLPPPAWPEQILVDTGTRRVMLHCRAIVRAQAAGNYVEVHAEGKPLLTRMTLEALQAQLDPAAFVRVNRSCLVRVEAIAELRRKDHGEMLVRLRDGTEVIWTRRYRRGESPLIPALSRSIPKT